MFSVKKCDNLECGICDFPRLPPSVFNELHNLPDPVPKGEHYEPFSDLYGKVTTEQHRPSLKEAQSKSHGMPFTPTAQYAKNTMMTINCSECMKPRVCYAKRKLKENVRRKFIRILEDLQYTCGSSLDDIEDEDPDSPVNVVKVRGNLVCDSLIEVPYFGANHKAICIYCAQNSDLCVDKGFYPICKNCVNLKKKKVAKRAGKE